MINDFADWLSPMLIKELRQGMRSRVLLTSLFLLQGMLICNVIGGFSIGTDSNAIQITNGFFWAILALPLLLILPASAMGAIGNEIKANTLELIFLTRLTARRIVVGKWIAVVAQAAILAVTVLPYVALRYYLGGVDVAKDLTTVFTMLILSAGMTALTVAVSSNQSKILRIFLVLGFFFFLQFGFYGIAFLTFGGGGSVVRGAGWHDGIMAAGLISLIPLLIALFLEIGTARIAPAAENHSGPIRLIVFLIVLTCCLTARFANDAKWMFLPALLIAGIFGISALSENPPVVRSLFRPFSRLGMLGKMAALIFTPGWHTGFIFVLLLLGCFAMFLFSSGDKTMLLSFGGYSATLLFPAALISSSSRKRILFYLAFIAFSGGAFFILSLLSNWPGMSDLYQLGVFLPPIAIFSDNFSKVSTFAPYPALWLSVLNALALILISWKSRQPFIDLLEKFRTSHVA